MENRCTGNLEISLFWEEKIVIIIRVLQLYSTFFLYYYENWPSKTRLLLTPMFSSILLSFHVVTQDMFYNFVTDFNQVWKATAAFIGSLIMVVIVLGTLRCKKRLNYRMEFTYTSKFNWYRWIYWTLEVLYLPLLVNATWCGNCSFVTKRAAVILTNCGRESEVLLDRVYYWLLKVGAIFALIIAILYNLTLFYLI